MANNVFGSLETRGMLGARARARAALQNRNEGKKGEQARNYVEKLREEAGDDGTMCLVYNATGVPVILLDYHDWSGRVAKSPYPTRIENGQWGAFFHSQSGYVSSSGALAFKGTVNRSVYQWLFAWKQNGGQINRCHTEVRQGWITPKWDAQKDHLNGGKSVHHAFCYTAEASASIGNTNNPIFEAILTLNAD